MMDEEHIGHSYQNQMNQKASLGKQFKTSKKIFMRYRELGLARNHLESIDKELKELMEQTHKGAAKWRNKSFPHYEDLCIVFGNDRAQGDRVRDVIEMENEANVEEQAEHTEGSHDTNTTNTSKIQGEEVSSVQTKKRKRTDSIVEGIISAAASLGKDLLTSSDMMSQSLNAEMDLQEKTSMLSFIGKIITST